MASSRIMIVEDDQTLLGVLKYNLTKEGYNVVTAIDGAQALEAARSEKPELIRPWFRIQASGLTLIIRIRR